MEGDKFDQNLFPTLKEDIVVINTRLQKVNKLNASDIIIAFLKDHSINGNLIDSNQEIVNLVINKNIPLGSIEKLFTISKDKPFFRNEFENYLRQQIK